MKRLPAVCGGLLPFVLLLLLAVGGCAQKGKKEDATRDALLPPESGKRVEQVKNEYFTLDLPPGWTWTYTGYARGRAMNAARESAVSITVTKSQDVFRESLKRDDKDLQKMGFTGDGRQFFTDTGKLKSVVVFYGDAAGELMQKHFTPGVPGLFPDIGKAVKNAYFTLDLPPGWSVFHWTTQERGLCCLVAVNEKERSLMWILVGTDTSALKGLFEPLRKELEPSGIRESMPGQSLQQKDPRRQAYFTDNGKQCSFISIIGKTPEKNRDILRKYFTPRDPKLFPASF